MLSSFEPWHGKTVVLRLRTGETRVPLSGIIIAETSGAIRLRIRGGWDINVYKSEILDVERERASLKYPMESTTLCSHSLQPTAFWPSPESLGGLLRLARAFYQGICRTSHFKFTS